MRYDDYEIDGDDADEEYTKDDHIPFVDYEGNGLWIFGIMGYDPSTNGVRVHQTLDRDSSIHKLVKRAVIEWEIDPRELIVSSCGQEVAMIAMHGMNVGE